MKRWKNHKFQDNSISLVPTNKYTHLQSHSLVSSFDPKFSVFQLTYPNINVDIIRIWHTHTQARNLVGDRRTHNSSSEADGVEPNVNMVCQLRSIQSFGFPVHEKKTEWKGKPKYRTKPSESTHTRSQHKRYLWQLESYCVVKLFGCKQHCIHSHLVLMFRSTCNLIACIRHQFHF